jgi:hypothetical protein
MSGGTGYPRHPQSARLGVEKPTAVEAVGSGAVSFVLVHGDGASVVEDGRRFWRRWRRALAGMCGEEAARGFK